MSKRFAALAGAALLATVPTARAATATLLYSFPPPPAFYADPETPLLMDRTGALYGETFYAGISSGGGGKLVGLGSIFRLTPPTAGQSEWSETDLYDFPRSAKRGAYPIGGLVADAQGNLYGTARSGGIPGCGNLRMGCGVAFRLAPPRAGSTEWKETVLHAFTGPDGAYPATGLVAGANGALYGATEYGGDGKGVVFELTPPSDLKAEWTERAIYVFPADGAKGSNPSGTLVADTHGAVYGVCGGGSGGAGIVFRLERPTAGRSLWIETVLHSFSGEKVAYPSGSLVMDQSGALYGAARGAAPSYEGNVFRLSPPDAGHAHWQASILHTFDAYFTAPSELLPDGSGGLYGTVPGDYSYSHNHGTLFDLRPPPAGQDRWTVNTVFEFHGHVGHYPDTPGSLVMDAQGALYGTTFRGGTYDHGAVFKIVP